MMALLEVVNGPDLNKKPGWCWVCKNESYVVTRFFFVFNNKQTAAAMNVQTTSASFKAEISKAMKTLTEGF